MTIVLESEVLCVVEVGQPVFLTLLLANSVAVVMSNI